MNLAAYLVMLAVCGIAAVTDIRTGRVPNRLTYPAVLLGLIAWPIVGLIGGGWAGAGQAAANVWIGMLSGLLPFAALILIGGLGGGDMKLMAAVGSLSAMWQVVLATTVYALILAVILAFVIMIKRGVVKQTLGNVLGAAMLAGARVRPELPRTSPTVPFAAAIALGAAMAGAEQMLGLQTPWSAFGP